MRYEIYIYIYIWCVCVYIYIYIYIYVIRRLKVNVCGFFLGGGRRRQCKLYERKHFIGSVCVKGKSADKAALLCRSNVITVIFTLLPTLQVRN